MVNFNEIGCKQCDENNHVDSIFVTFEHTVHEFREKLFPRIKSEIQLRDFFPTKPEKSKIREIKSASTIGPGRGGTSYLTDFDETWPV